MSEIITANKAAQMIGCPARTVRARLRRGVWKFGRAIPPKGEEKQWRYEVYSKQLQKYLEGE